MIKKIINSIYSVLTRIVITSTDKAVLERAWNNDYKPFGYKQIKLVEYKGYWKLVVCRNI